MYDPIILSDHYPEEVALIGELFDEFFPEEERKFTAMRFTVEILDIVQNGTEGSSFFKKDQQLEKISNSKRSENLFIT